MLLVAELRFASRSGPCGSNSRTLIWLDSVKWADRSGNQPPDSPIGVATPVASFQFITVGATIAQAQPDPSDYSSHGASGFVLVDRTVINDPDARGTLVHEFFHVLQFR